MRVPKVEDQCPYEWVARALSPGIKWPGHEADHLHLAARSGMAELYLHWPIRVHEGKIWPICYIFLTASVVWWSEFLATDPEARVRFPALPEKKCSGSGTGSIQPREYN
jgi:hypothetical protein